MAIDPAQLGETVQDLRLRAEMSQEGLAKAAGVSMWTINRLERGAHTPSRLTLQRVARALGMSVPELLDGKAS